MDSQLDSKPSLTHSELKRRHRRRAAGAAILGLALVVSFITILNRRMSPGRSAPVGPSPKDSPELGKRGSDSAPVPAFDGIPGWNRAGAEREARKAIGLTPNATSARLRLDDLRGDPRYLDLVKRLKFPEN